MATLAERLNDEWKAAMRSGDGFRRDIVSGLRAAVKNAEINGRVGDNPFDATDDVAVEDIIEREAKKRRDAIEEYTKAGRADRADAEAAELKLIQEFLPQQFSDEELETLVRETMAEIGADGMKSMGPLMSALKPKTAKRADGKRVNEVVRRLLAA